jgi:hypothetical protein
LLGRGLAASALVRRVGKPLTCEEECQRILASHGPNDFEGISEALDRQFRTLQNRAQLLLGICGVLISASVLVTTGRLIGHAAQFEHRRTAGAMLVVAGVLEVGAAAIIVGAVLGIRWITRQPGENLESWVFANIVYRDRKTWAYRFSTVLVVISMACYQTAIAIAMLQL